MENKKSQKNGEDSSSDEILALNISKSFDPKKDNLTEAIQESWVLSPVRASNVKFIIGFIRLQGQPKCKIVGIVKASNNGWQKEDEELSKRLKRKRQRYTFNPIRINNEYPELIGLEFELDKSSNSVRYFKISEIIKN